MVSVAWLASYWISAEPGHPVYGGTCYIGAVYTSPCQCNIGSGWHVAAAMCGRQLRLCGMILRHRLSTNPDQEATIGLSLVQSVVSSLHMPHVICSACFVLLLSIEIILLPEQPRWTLSKSCWTVALLSWDGCRGPALLWSLNITWTDACFPVHWIRCQCYHVGILRLSTLLVALRTGRCSGRTTSAPSVDSDSGASTFQI